MILPIRSYGDPVLKKVAQDIEPGHPGLKQLIADMYETCLLYTSPSPRDRTRSRMPSSA